MHRSWTQLGNRFSSGDTSDERKSGWAALEKRIYQMAHVVKLGDAGIKQASVAKVAGFKPFRSPRLWDVWFE